LIIAVTGEGATDYGTGSSIDWNWGPVAVYLNRIADANKVNIELSPIHKKEVDNIRLQRHSFGLKGKAVSSRKFYIAAREKGMKFGVYYCDSDLNASRRGRKTRDLEKAFNERCAEVDKGLEAGDGKFIAMIPMSMIECWMLADSSAFVSVFNGKPGSEKLITKKPEELWGDERDPDSDYPKCYLNRILKQVASDTGKNLANRENFIEIAGRQDLDKVKKVCNRSFDRFSEEYVKLLNEYGKEEH